jgi:hypothetical protein
MGCAKWKKGAHSAGEMSAAERLFGNEVIGYGEPVARGAALGYPEQHGGFTDLLDGTMRAEMGDATLEEQRYLMRGGARGNPLWAPMKPLASTSRTNENPEEFWNISTGDLPYTFPKKDKDEGEVEVEEVEKVNIKEPPAVGDPRRGFVTPQKGLPGFGNYGLLPGEKKPEVPPGPPEKASFEATVQRLGFDPIAEQLNQVSHSQVGKGRGGRKTRKGGRKTRKGGRKTRKGGRKTRKGGRKTRKGGRSRKTQRGGRRKNFLNVRVSGRIRLQERHHQ